MASRKQVRQRPSVLILGSTGMLGSMVEKYLKTVKGLKVTETDRRMFAVEDFLQQPQHFDWIKNFDYLINCIGIIKPYCKDDDAEGVVRAIEVNSLFPHRLAEFLQEAKTKVIQIATDCVYSGMNGPYDEKKPHDPIDVYGKSKSLGEVFAYQNFLNIRASIIGPELKGNLSLLEWFLAQPEGSELTGFTHHKWNGVTTLQFAQLCESIILNESFTDLRKLNHSLHFIPNQDITKYEMLLLFKEVFERVLTVIERSDVGIPVDRRIISLYSTPLLNPARKQPLKKALIQLKNFMKEQYA